MFSGHESEIRRFTDERHYRPATVERWLGLAERDAHALLQLARDLRLGENQLRDLWGWAEEIAARDRSTLHDTLNSQSVNTAVRGAGGRAERLKRVKEALRRLRFPSLVQTEEVLRELVGQLGLPQSVRVSLPPSLEGDHVRIEFQISRPSDLGDIAAALARAAASTECSRIFEMLGETP